MERSAAQEEIAALVSRASAAADDAVWIEVIRKMDEIYHDLLQYEVALEEKNAALEESQQFIASVLASMSDLLLVCDRAGRIESVNAALSALLGRMAEEVVGRVVFDFVDDEASRTRLGEIFAASRAQPVVDCEVRLRARGGSAIPISLNCTPRKSGAGRLLGFVITGRPVGELRRAYEALSRAHEDLKNAQLQLVQSEKMASLGRLVAGVAHELNNPISFVYGNALAMRRYAERLRRYLEAVHGGADADALAELRRELRIDRLLEDLPSLIEGLVEGAERTRDIVDALKRFSARGGEGRERFDLGEVIARAVHWVAKGPGSKLEVLLEVPEKLVVEGAAGQLQQVVMNLVQNAVDATGGREKPRLEIRACRRNDWVEVEFRDNGPGIEEAHLPHLFDPFFTTKPVGQGTGLGLAISFGIVERHGGRLEAENHPRGGAVFRLCLPAAGLDSGPSGK